LEICENINEIKHSNINDDNLKKKDFGKKRKSNNFYILNYFIDEQRENLEEGFKLQRKSKKT